MKKYIITTESGSDLSKEIIDRYNIKVVPMHVTMEEQMYPDGSFDVQKVFLANKGFYVELTTAATFAGYFNYIKYTNSPISGKVVLTLCGAGLKSDNK